MWDLPWTDSALLVDRRIMEELLKRRFGEPKIEFTIPINWIDEFDIFSNLRAQDPFGLDASTADPITRGEYGRYYYVESLTYNPLSQTITVRAVDLQFILRQCMIVADCDDVEPTGSMSDNWAGASEADRMYAYVADCATEEFSDGEPAKKICPCE